MIVELDKSVDILRVRFTSGRIEESDEIAPGIIFDYDTNGKIVGMEVLDASKAFDVEGFEAKPSKITKPQSASGDIIAAKRKVQHSKVRTAQA